CEALRISEGLVVESVGLKARIESMSPVSATTVVMARNSSSLLVMGRASLRRVRLAPIVAPERVMCKRQTPGARMDGRREIGVKTASGWNQMGAQRVLH